MTRSLNRLLRPKTIAVIGGSEAAAVIEQCLAIGFEGELWPVHPTKTEVHGRRVYHSVEELPSAPDAAFVAVNRDQAIKAVRQLSGIGAGGAICYAAGFSETNAEGEDLQAALVEAAGEMTLIGPNCYGLLNYIDGIALWPDQHGGIKLNEGATGVAIITQSSNIAINLSMQRRGLPVSFILTAGNQAQTGLSQMALALLDDPAVTALGLHIEGFDSIKGMEEVALKSRTLQKPVVALKIGRSTKAREAAFTHTASLAGSHVAADAFLRRIGIGQVSSLPSFLEALKLLHVHGPLDGYNISSMSCSGGEASLMADACHGRRTGFPDLSKTQIKAISDVLGSKVTIANPLDYHTYIWGERDALEAVFSGMLNGGFSLNFLILDYPRADRCNDGDWRMPTDALVAAARKTGAKTAVISTLQENISEAQAMVLIDQGVAPMLGINETLDAIEAAAEIAEAWKKRVMPGVETILVNSSMHDFIPDEARAKQILSSHSILVPKGNKSASIKTIIKDAEKIGFPVVLKALGLAHKSERNGVILDLGDGAAVGRGANELKKISDELYVEQQIVDGIFELLIGLSYDEQFGLVMTLATGGVMVEVFADSQTLLLPFDESAVEEALRQLKSAVFFNGFRGGAKADLVATIATVMAVQDFALKNADNLIELDINPLIVRPAGKGAIAADALIKFRREIK
ncbi:MAG: acetate--CoA ligase family protein [Rhizobiaceae bacterium]|nr:acetate--CoA ligase family protein [Rhizobiaceae bacterium]